MRLFQGPHFLLYLYILCIKENMKDLYTYLVESTKNDPLTLNPYNIFILVKPGFVKNSTAIINLFKSRGYDIAKYGARRMTRPEVEDFYISHKDEDYYEDLCKYMSSGVCAGYLLNYTGEGDPIKTTDKIKKEVRETWGKDEMKNALHSSDSKENVHREAKIFFNK